jgi:hypothetical protein
MTNCFRDSWLEESLGDTDVGGLSKAVTYFCRHSRCPLRHPNRRLLNNGIEAYGCNILLYKSTVLILIHAVGLEIYAVRKQTLWVLFEHPIFRWWLFSCKVLIVVSVSVPEVALAEQTHSMDSTCGGLFHCSLTVVELLFVVWLNVWSESDRRSEGRTRCDRRWEIVWSGWNVADSPPH